MSTSIDFTKITAVKCVRNGKTTNLPYLRLGGTDIGVITVWPVAWKSCDIYISGDAVYVRVIGADSSLAGSSTKFKLTYRLYAIDFDGSRTLLKEDNYTSQPTSSGNLRVPTMLDMSSFAYGKSYYAEVFVDMTGTYAGFSGTTDEKVVRPWLGYATKPSTASGGTYTAKEKTLLTGGTNWREGSTGDSYTQTNAGTYTLYARPKFGYRWSGTDHDTSNQLVGSVTIGKATLQSSNISVTMSGASGTAAKATVTVTFGGTTHGGLNCSGVFRRRKKDDGTIVERDGGGSGTTGKAMTSTGFTAMAFGTYGYGFQVKNISGGTNFIDWSGSVGAGSWYTG